MDIVEAIVKFMASRCACVFTADQLTDRVFLCHPSSPQSVTYRAQLHGTLQATVTDLITIIEEWVSSGDVIPVQFLPLKLDGACTSFSSSTVECEVKKYTEMEYDTPNKSTESTEIGKGTSGGIETVIGGVVGVVAVVAVMAFVIIIFLSVIITIKIRKAKMKPKDESE